MSAWSRTGSPRDGRQRNAGERWRPASRATGPDRQPRIVDAVAVHAVAAVASYDAAPAGRGRQRRERVDPEVEPAAGDAQHVVVRPVEHERPSRSSRGPTCARLVPRRLALRRASASRLSTARAAGVVAKRRAAGGDGFGVPAIAALARELGLTTKGQLSAVDR